MIQDRGQRWRFHYRRHRSRGPAFWPAGNPNYETVAAMQHAFVSGFAVLRRYIGVEAVEETAVEQVIT